MVDAHEQIKYASAVVPQTNDVPTNFGPAPHTQISYGFSYKGNVHEEICNTKPLFKGQTRFFILKSNSMQNLTLSQDH